jgi:hypothetical protein
MALQTFWQEPPYRADLIDAQRRITSPWHLWTNGVAKFLGRRLIVDAAADPPNLIAGASVSAAVTVPGAVAGDFAVASFDPMNAGISLTAQTTAANTVTVWFTNLSGAPIDLGAGTLRVLVEKYK